MKRNSLPTIQQYHQAVDNALNNKYLGLRKRIKALAEPERSKALLALGIAATDRQSTVQQISAEFDIIEKDFLGGRQ